MQKPNTQGMTGEYWDFVTTLKRCQAQHYRKALGIPGEAESFCPDSTKKAAEPNIIERLGAFPLHFCHFAHMCSPQGSANNLHSLLRHELPPKYTASTMNMPGVHLEAYSLDIMALPACLQGKQCHKTCEPPHSGAE